MKKVKVIIFDVDGTLYKPVPELSQELDAYWIKRIMYHLHINEIDAAEEFKQLKKQYQSSTLALASIGLGSIRLVSKQAEHHMRPYLKKYVRKDRDLIKILKRLKLTFRLGTLRNGTRAGTRYILSLIGYAPRRDKTSNGFGPFDHIFPTIELGITKPDPVPFINILKKFDVDPEQILMIGDRENVDLKTAKELGMKTVLVDWGRNIEVDENITDMKIDTIYDLKELIK